MTQTLIGLKNLFTFLHRFQIRVILLQVQNKVVSRTQLAFVEPEITIEDTMITTYTYTSVYRPSIPESGEYEGMRS